MQSTRPVIYRNGGMDSTRWAGFVFRPGDIVISTPFKCGTTWLQRICALLVFGSPSLDRPLHRISPWLDMLTRPLDEVLADLDAQTHRRFIKTHTPFDGLPVQDGVTYVCLGRDPRDVALSWDNHETNMNNAAMERVLQAAAGGDLLPTATPTEQEQATSAHDRFWQWVVDPTPATETMASLLATLHHLTTFWAVRDKTNVVMLHYADLKTDLDGQMRLLSERLDIPTSHETWGDLVHAATLDAMRENATMLTPHASDGIWHDNKRFFHRARMGQWREFLDEQDLERYHQRVAELAPPDLADWLHRPA
jgi:aryl sulfotransferase